MKKIFALHLVVLIGFIHLNAQQNQSEKAAFIADLISRMSLEEKIGQMNQFNGFWDVTGPVPDGGDAARKYKDLREGRVGSMLNITSVAEVRKIQEIALKTRLGIPVLFGQDVIHGFRTISPIPLAEAASWDLDAIEASAALAAREAAASGINWTFAPMVDISRDPRWGRVMEGAGEDPYLGSLVGVARVKGFQGSDLSDPLTVAACVKHFAGYGLSEGGRDYNRVDLGMPTLFDVILPPFKATLDAGAATFMNAFNDLNGIPATGSAFLQREILKGDWGFEGMIVSDWGSIGEMVPHGYAKDLKEAAKAAVIGGSDMDMESMAYLNHLQELVQNGSVSESLIDDAVRRILNLKYDLGLFQDPFKYCDPKREQEVLSDPKRFDIVRDMAKRSIVLLKNQGDLLPLPKQGKKIAVIGQLAADKDSPLGSWRLKAEPNSAVSVLEGLAAYSGNEIKYAQGVKLTEGTPLFHFETHINTTDRSEIPEAVALARNSDMVIMVLGENGFQTGEARSYSELDLPGLQQELLEAVYAVNPNIVLVLMNGRPLTIGWAAEHVPAIVEAWHLGSESGNAIAQVLYGDYNPSGKLPMTFPKNTGQIPLYYSRTATGRPNNPGNDLVFWSHYVEGNEPLFAFGHGLSYTNFAYSDLKVNKPKISGDEALQISVTLTNTGAREGQEVVQLYVRDHFGSRTRPLRELKGFKTVVLEPGASKTIQFELQRKDLSFYSANNRMEAEPGEFTIYVGGSSNATLATGFTWTE
ncbi:MAG: hypothetical protein RLZZ241_1130 [Bacteroidota bacterium]